MEEGKFKFTERPGWVPLYAHQSARIKGSFLQLFKAANTLKALNKACKGIVFYLNEIMNNNKSLFIKRIRILDGEFLPQLFIGTFENDPYIFPYIFLMSFCIFWIQV